MTTSSNKSSFRSYFCRVKANDLVLFGILFLGIVGEGATMAKVGGMGNVKTMEGVGVEDRSQIEGFLEQVRAAAEAKAGRTFASLKAVEYATQLVNGINYFIKASTGDGKFVFLRLYKPFQGDVSFVSIQDDKTEKDPLAYF